MGLSGVFEVLGFVNLDLVAEWIHFTPFWDNITHYKTKSVHFLGGYELSN